MAELTEFQQKKILKVFSMLYDSNNDGVIERQDFDIYLQKVADGLEWTAGSPRYRRAKETLDIVWKGLLEYADTDKDLKVTQDEWLRMWGDCLADIEKGRFPAWQQKYMDLMFDVNDKSGDEEIDLGEYTTFLELFGVSTEDCCNAFQLFSGGSNISREDFAGLWKGFLTSNDETAAANFLLGTSL